MPNASWVSNIDELISTLANNATSHIILAAGCYVLTAELTLVRTVTIEAAVLGSVVLDAQGGDHHGHRTSRLLSIDPGTLNTVQLVGINVTGGHLTSSPAQGGGLIIRSGSVILRDCDISQNHVQHYTTGYGGGVFIAGGRVVMSNCRIHANAARAGGGIYIADGTVALTNCTISDNHATGEFCPESHPRVNTGREFTLPPGMSFSKGLKFMATSARAIALEVESLSEAATLELF